MPRKLQFAYHVADSYEKRFIKCFATAVNWVRNEMDVNEHERLSNSMLIHKLK